VTSPAASSLASLPWLALAQLLPAVGALVVLRLGERPAARAVGRLWALLCLLPPIFVFALLPDRVAGFHLVETIPLIGYHAAADGITAIFMLLTGLICALCALYSLVRGLASPGRLLAVLLACEAALMSALVTMNLIWFALSWAAEVALVGYLLGQWATSTEENRTVAVNRYIQFQTFGWLLFIAGIVVIAWNHADFSGGTWSFDLIELTAAGTRHAPFRFQEVAFFLMFYGLAIRTPLFPLHGWLPPVAHRGMVAIAPGLLLGIKIGIYGMLRFVLPLTPDAILAWQSFVVGFAMVGVFYTAALAFQQTNLRRLLSFAVVSHTSLIVIGLFSLHPLGIQGAVMLSVNFGLAVTVMLFMVGFVFTRTKTTDLDRLGGLFDRIPLIAAAFFIGGLSIIGMPGTPGFDAAHLVLEAAIGRFGALPTVATALGNVAAAGFLLWAFQRAFLAPPRPGMAQIQRTEPREVLIAIVAVAVLMFAGFYSEPWMRLTDAPAHSIAAEFVPPEPGGGH
jgi:NADH-quinone oxidoreductase subunit M